MCEYFEASTNTRIVVMIPERMKEKDRFLESSFASRVQHRDYLEHISMTADCRSCELQRQIIPSDYKDYQ